jgi:hypothetical protein
MSTQDFGSFGSEGDFSWWSDYSVEKQQAVVAAIQAIRTARGLDRASGYAADILRDHTRSLEDGGGFVVPHRDGTQCLCVANTAADITRQIDGSERCPSGTGGVPGTNVGGDRPSVTQTRLRPTATVIAAKTEKPKSWNIDDPKDDEDVLPLALPDGDVTDPDAGLDPDAGNEDDAYKNETLTCPEGMVLDESLTCVPVAEPKPWYKSPWVWIGGAAAVGVVVGGVYLARRKR